MLSPDASIGSRSTALVSAIFRAVAPHKCMSWTTGFSRSAAIRFALVAAAARLRDRQALCAEVAVLEADEADRAEMRAVAELMEQLRA